nr:MAG TPA: DNA polymerase I [Caudoviricetes sp.]
MLISVGKKEQDIKLPKLNTTPASKSVTAPKVQRAKALIDDSQVVSKKMEELFSSYDWRVVTTEEELIEYISTRKELGFDTETTGLDIFRSKLVGFSLGTETDCIYVPLTHKKGANYTGDVSKLGDLLRGRDIYGFNAKFDMKVMKYHTGVDIKVKWCGYLAARLMNSAEPSNELKELYIKYVNRNAQFYAFSSLFKNTFDEYDPAIVGAYAAVDAMKHIALGKWQEAHIGKAERKLLMNLELPLAHNLVDIELTGVALDIDWCNELSSILEKDLKAASDAISAEYPGLNPGSPKQVAEWLYDKLGMPQLNGRGTGSDTLKKLNHPLADKILEYRKAQKLLSTYAGKMPKEAYEGVIHCTFNQYGADTGRFSSSGPNLQNIPRDDRFRKMFKARDGHMLVSCDYTQQEVYILAALADDESMKAAYAMGMDFYAYMASIVFDVPYEQCTKSGARHELRNQMKSIVLGLNYDMGLTSLARDIHKSVEETKAIYARFFEKCPTIKTFRQRNLDFAIKNGYVETILGRKRYFNALHKPDFDCDVPEILDTIRRLRSERAIQQLIADAKAEGIEVIDRRAQKVFETRQVVNSIIQGSAADMTKLAMIQACKDERLKALGCKIVLQIHDEIIAEFPEENAEEGGKVLADLMVDVGSDLIGIKMKCDPSVMKFWQKD